MVSRRRPGATRWAARCRHRPATRSGPGLRSRRDKRTGSAAGARAGTGLVPGPGRRRRVGLAWPRLPAAAEVAIIAAGFAVPGMTDVLVRYRILGVGRPHGPDSQVNLYAAMPSLHVAWAAWCAAALVAATRGRRRHLAWLYPAATTLDVLATANHFLAAAAAGLAITALGLLATRAATRPDAT